MKLLLVILQANTAQIEEKIKNAPDSSYEIGVVIGTYLPFVFLVRIGLVVLLFCKKKGQKQTGLRSKKIFFWRRQFCQDLFLQKPKRIKQ